jgi:50S ribosomal subunit-associated GTPase HflX
LGDTVKFTSNRNGLTYTGTVRKVKIKYILVDTNGGLFNVPANMLEAA